jgi:hypothetical protein
VQLTLSVLESLTRLPVSEREAILASLSESEAEQLQYDWKDLHDTDSQGKVLEELSSSITALVARARPGLSRTMTRIQMSAAPSCVPSQWLEIRKSAIVRKIALTNRPASQQSLREIGCCKALRAGLCQSLDDFQVVPFGIGAGSSGRQL